MKCVKCGHHEYLRSDYKPGDVCPECSEGKLILKER